MPFEQSLGARDIHSSISSGKDGLDELVQSTCQDDLIGCYCCRWIWKGYCEKQKRNQSHVFACVSLL